MLGGPLPPYISHEGHDTKPLWISKFQAPPRLGGLKPSNTTSHGAAHENLANPQYERQMCSEKVESTSLTPSWSFLAEENPTWPWIRYSLIHPESNQQPTKSPQHLSNAISNRKFREALRLLKSGTVLVEVGWITTEKNRYLSLRFTLHPTR